MSDQLKLHLAQFKRSSLVHCLAEIGHGIEKESLRIDGYGRIAMTPHPGGLGSALTHPFITTDFSEALLEFITPVFNQPADSVKFLEDLHCFVYDRLGPDEFLWTSSMPCILREDSQIPIAQYGSSNTGRLKTLYRVGLSNRYGRAMQTIAGIHYNFSLSDNFWKLFQLQKLGSTQSLQDFKTEQYFNLIRNFRRYSWLLIYLFGASPALCRSFLSEDSRHSLEEFDGGTLYAPYGTSLRMGDLGYTSKAQAGLYVSYNSLSEYLGDLRKAISTPYPPYESFDRPGELNQLNPCILQIENEFYSTIRPKREVPAGSRPIQVLGQLGVEYVEVRCLDLNPFLPVGIDEQQMHFLNSFLLFCLLRRSPPSSPEEHLEINGNVQAVVNRGRDPNLLLRQAGRETPLREWARGILDDVAEIAGLLDRIGKHDLSTSAVAAQIRKVEDSALTPSARVLERMRTMKNSFTRFALDQSLACSDYFRGRPLSPARFEEFSQLSAQSRLAQQAMEESDDVDFETYLERMNEL